MLQEILALPWIDIFFFALKFISAWVVAAFLLALPLAALKWFTGSD